MGKENTIDAFRKTRINIFVDIAKEIREMHKTANDPRLPCDLRQVLSMGMETAHYTLKQFLDNDEELFQAVLKVIIGTAK